MTSPFNEAFDYYIAHQDELVEKYDGKVIVIKDCTVLGAFDGYGAALEWARERFEPETYALQKVSEGPKDYTITLHTPMPLRHKAPDNSIAPPNAATAAAQGDSAMTSPLDEAFDYYIAHQDELVEKYDGKVIVIKDCTVLGAFDGYGDASVWARERFEPETYALQKVSEGPKDYTIYLHTPMPLRRP